MRKYAATVGIGVLTVTEEKKCHGEGSDVLTLLLLRDKDTIISLRTTNTQILVSKYQ